MGAWSGVPRALARSGVGHSTECMGAWSGVPRALARSGAWHGTECMGAWSGVGGAPRHVPRGMARQAVRGEHRGVSGCWWLFLPLHVRGAALMNGRVLRPRERHGYTCRADEGQGGAAARCAPLYPSASATLPLRSRLARAPREHTAVRGRTRGVNGGAGGPTERGEVNKNILDIYNIKRRYFFDGICRAGMAGFADEMGWD